MLSVVILILVFLFDEFLAAFASLDTGRDGPPFEVQEGNEHKTETNDDCDVQRPVREFIFDKGFSENLIVELKGVAHVRTLAVGNDVDFVRAFKLIRFLTGLRHDDVLLLGLVLPEIYSE